MSYCHPYSVTLYSNHQQRTLWSTEMMTETEIKNAGTTTLQLRLIVVEYSTIASYQQEAAAIIAELALRKEG
jgi:hypothetical protein